MVEVITYEVLYDLLREEKASNSLVKLDVDFFEKVTKYITEKEAILNSQEKKASVFSASESLKTKKQLDNIQKIIKELYERREFKIIDLALFHSRTSEPIDLSILLEMEKQFYHAILESLNLFRKDILYALLQAKIPKISQQKSPEFIQERPKELKTVKFVQAVPKFVGTDMQIYGPFEEEDIASIPAIVADVLLRKEKVTIL